MKTTGKITKIFALVLCAAMLMLFVASCGASNAVVLSYTADNGKTYTLTEAEYAFLMKYRKYEVFSSYGYPSSWDVAEFWESDSGDNKTLDATVTESVLETAKSVVIEKYLMDKYGLSIENDADMKKEMDEAVETIKKAAKNLGGSGAFKRYWGYTTDELVNYNKMILTSEMVSTHLYDDKDGISKLTDEQLNDYYKENYKQYFMILINTKEDIKKDDDGNKLVVVKDKNNKEVTITLDQALDKEFLKEKEYTLSYTFKYESVTDKDKQEEQKDLANTILQRIKDGEDFKTLALEYSEEFLTHFYENGYMVSGDLISDKDAIEVISELEIGEMTDKVLSLQSDKYIYIVKRIDLTEKAYTHADEDAEETEYKDIFTNFKTTVKNHTYSELLKAYAKDITVNTNITGKYNMKDTFLSKEIYYTYG